ncbi:TetR family transcriptional regulator [Antrihabitans stalactiti]|uniref:TetR/AcrR family transcriptional regulator n=1 Tax=Antrihabitans stalactiti TaxID=2584121 RepID=A0A848K8P3_9NOCA|nr:TetR/AcrR family transcriptional regulator [Antrihabitans stalactiti]
MAKPVTKRRTETRERLVDAAYEAFADIGFGRSTVEQVCERAGYTRGAFYSNFTSLDELFLAMWERKSAELLTGVRAALDDDAPAVRSVGDIVEHFAGVVPIDDVWYRITAEFTAHALRHPSLRRVMAAREAAISAALTPVLETLLNRIGRTIPDHVAMGQALVAVHDGTTVQVLLEPDDAVVRARRITLLTHVITAYSEDRK